MGGMKTDRTFDVNEDHGYWLKEMATKFDLPDEHKALRCLLDYAMTDGDLDAIFGEIRCKHC